LLATNKKPTEAQVKDALANNLCRCGTHARIVKAVMRAASA
jgi:nicotinate dehydrogenase subunit A